MRRLIKQIVNLGLALFLFSMSVLYISCESDSSSENSSLLENNDLSTFSDADLINIFGEQYGGTLKSLSREGVNYEIIRYDFSTNSAGTAVGDVIIASSETGTSPSAVSSQETVVLTGTISFSDYDSVILLQGMTSRNLTVVDTEIQECVINLNEGDNYIVVLLLKGGEPVRRSTVVDVKYGNSQSPGVPDVTIKLLWESDGLKLSDSSFHWEDLDLYVRGVNDLNLAYVNEVSKNNRKVSGSGWIMQMEEESGDYIDSSNKSLGINPGGGPETITVSQKPMYSYIQVMIDEGEAGSISNLRNSGKKWAQVFISKKGKDYEIYNWKIEKIKDLKIGTEAIKADTKELTGNYYVPLD